ncbi:MAG: glycosyltransferase family 4 protein [Actinomycetota bacterium]
MSPGPLRVAVLAYRGNPHSGGQGVYTRYLATELRQLGHHVEVLSGPPYPELDDQTPLHRLESMDLYRPERPFRPHRWPRTRTDWLELGLMSTGAFPEPRAFSIRADRWFREHGDCFDVVHDNQCLGTGIYRISQRMPLLATVHHPITVDKKLELAETRNPWRQITKRRWYSFLGMQKRVARKLPRLITVSQTSRADIIEQIRIDPDRIDVVPVGVDTEIFQPRPEIAKVPGRLIAVISSDVALKGLSFLLEALAKLRIEHAEAHLVVIGRMRSEDPGRRHVTRLGLEDAVTFTGNISYEEMQRLYGEAEVAVVPSLYEGFSLPSIQAMACGVPLVCTRAGAIPEVAGTDNETALLVEPADPGALALAIKRLLDEPELRNRLAAAALDRALERFTWATMAKQTVDQYRIVIDQHRRSGGTPETPEAKVSS